MLGKYSKLITKHKASCDHWSMELMMVFQFQKEEKHISKTKREDRRDPKAVSQWKHTIEERRGR
jgi:hypothetical protein